MGNRKKPIDKLVAQTRLPAYVMKVVEQKSVMEGITVSEYLRDLIIEEMSRRHGKELEIYKKDLIAAYVVKTGV